MKLHQLTAIILLLKLTQIDERKGVSACGQLQPTLADRITNANDTHHWPWHAGLYHIDNDSQPSYKCGGTLISSQYILTAAHCVFVEAKEVMVSLGRLYLNASASFIEVF